MNEKIDQLMAILGKGTANIRRLGVETNMKSGDVMDSDPDKFRPLPYSNV